MPPKPPNSRRTRRRSIAVAGVVGLVLALVLAVGATASGSRPEGRLLAYVHPANTGPLRVGDAVWNYVYVANLNRPTNTSGRNRMTLPDAFVVDDVNQRVYVDGSLYSDATFHPPPNSELAGWAGRWPTTVTCPSGTVPPCTTVGQPAVIPGENTVVLFPGWIHGAGEPNGTYVFRYTIHGTQNGAPVELTATTPPIEMVD